MAFEIVLMMIGSSFTQDICYNIIRKTTKSHKEVDGSEDFPAWRKHLDNDGYCLHSHHGKKCRSSAVPKHIKYIMFNHFRVIFELHIFTVRGLAQLFVIFCVMIRELTLTCQTSVRKEKSPPAHRGSIQMRSEDLCTHSHKSGPTEKHKHKKLTLTKLMCSYFAEAHRCPAPLLHIRNGTKAFLTSCNHFHSQSLYSFTVHTYYCNVSWCLWLTCYLISNCSPLAKF